jgi:preprotein translocase subunit SecB
MSSTGTPVAPTQTSYQDFLRSVQPSEVALNSITARLERAAFFAWVESEEERIAHSVTAKYDLGQIDKSSFDALIYLDLKSRPGGPAGQVVLAIECSLFARFQVAGPMQTEHITRFAHSEARLVIWPYVRELVSNITGKMGIHPIVLPLVIRSGSPTAEHSAPTRKQAEAEPTKHIEHRRSTGKKR